MADRSIVVTLKAVVSDFKSKLEQAGKASGDLADRVERSQASLDKLSGVATVAGGALAAGLGFAAKAAIDWESAWAGVKKTVDGSDAQLQQLEGSLREMARTMPATHSEIAAVAEAAGQLGVATEDVAGFTKTMIMLGETTNLSADEAATAIAQIQNITGMAAGDVDRFAATLVKLGNNGASTEAEILALSNRIAGAANIVGLAEKDLLALSNAMASAGIQAELGGSAMSRALIGMNTAVLDGGDKLEAFARISGMSAEQFASAWRSDPVTAVESFVKGLSRINKEGGNAAAALGEVGLKGTQNTQVFLALAGASDMLSESIAMAGGEWGSATALAEEYGKRVQTTEAQIQIAWNNIKDAAIEAGAAMLPAIAGMAQGVAGLAAGFAGLPEPVKAAGSGFAALAAGTLLAVGGVSKLVSFGLDIRSMMSDLAEISPKAGAGVKGLAAGLGALTAAGAIVTIGQVIHSMEKVVVTSEDARTALERLAKTGDTVHLDRIFAGLDKYLTTDAMGKLNTLDEALRTMADSTSGWGKVRGDIQSVLGLGGDIVETKTALAELDAQLARMDPSMAAKAFDTIRTSQEGAKLSTEQLAAIFPQYAAALQGAAREGGSAVTATEAIAAALGGVEDEADGAVQALTKLGNAFLKLSGTEMDLEEAMDAATESIEKNGKTAIAHGSALDIDSEAGRRNKEALMGIASSYLALAEEQMKNGASAAEMADSQARAVGAFIASAEAAGLTREAAAKLAAQFGMIPDDVATQISAPGANLTQQEIEDVTRAARLVPGLTEAKVLAPGARPSKADVDAFMASVKDVPGLTTAQIKTIAELYGVEQAKRAIAGVQGKSVTVAVDYQARGSTAQTRQASSRATGGPVYGPGTTTSDSILAMLSNREFVHTAAAHDYYGSRLMWAINERRIPKDWFAPLGFAGGGSPSSPAPVRYAPNYSPPAYAPQASRAQGRGDVNLYVTHQGDTLQRQVERAVWTLDKELVGRVDGAV